MLRIAYCVEAALNTEYAIRTTAGSLYCFQNCFFSVNRGRIKERNVRMLLLDQHDNFRTAFDYTFSPPAS